MARNTAAEAREWIARYPLERVLTDRQVEVVHLLAAGHTLEEIAAALGVGRGTVVSHVTLIRLRMDAHARRAEQGKR